MNRYKLINGDCLIAMKSLPSQSVDLVITSPPYYNARDYIQYHSFDEYKETMVDTFTLVYDKLRNYKYCIVNVSDVIGKLGKSNSTKQRLPISSSFILFMIEIGFRYIDDIIWDKGEVQSKRNFAGEPYPFYKYPINCYEHILVFQKIDNNINKPTCPLCNEDNVVSNGLVNGIKTFECKNDACVRSESGRGKRFSMFTKMRDGLKKEENRIDDDTLKLWRRDIVKINPVIKINSKGVNTIGHSAPFPLEIPDWAIKYYTGVNDTVLDCFMGSGTTGVVCLENNRRFIGIELDENYYNIAKQRIENQENKLKVA